MMSRYGSIRLAWLGILALSGTAQAAGARVKFSIPSEQLQQAVVDFYAQTHIEIVYATTPRLQRVNTRPVLGQFTPLQSFARMFKGTPVTIEAARPVKGGSVTFFINYPQEEDLIAGPDFEPSPLNQPA
jgi:hypothetical protein